MAPAPVASHLKNILKYRPMLPRTQLPQLTPRWQPALVSITSFYGVPMRPEICHARDVLCFACPAARCFCDMEEERRGEKNNNNKKTRRKSLEASDVSFEKCRPLSPTHFGSTNLTTEVSQPNVSCKPVVR